MSASEGRERLRMMTLIRRFEEKCAEEYSAGRIRGFLHLYVGEEAIAAGIFPCLTPEDAAVATYREHGHALARGIPAGAIMAEMFGRVEGCSLGRGGSMHLFDASRRFLGGNAIVGSGIPLAVGLGLADSMLGRPRVTACFFGEGAVAEGDFHESMNLAALWKLPVLFCCENNFYAMGTALARSESVTDIHAKAASYGVPSEIVDGMDVDAVESAARAACESIRSGGGPRFLELRTYRFRAHSMFDAELYRDKAEVEQWKMRDPLITHAARLKRAGLLEDADVAAIESEVGEIVREAVEFAAAGRLEPVADLERDVLAPPGWTGGLPP